MSLQEEIAKYSQAAQEEFQVEELSREELEKKARSFLLNHLKDGLTGIVDLALGAESENTRFQACKFLYEICMGEAGKAEPDELKKLLNELTTVNS